MTLFTYIFIQRMFAGFYAFQEPYSITPSFTDIKVWKFRGWTMSKYWELSHFLEENKTPYSEKGKFSVVDAK